MLEAMLATVGLIWRHLLLGNLSLLFMQILHVLAQQ
jgi:hypothetical protein